MSGARGGNRAKRRAEKRVMQRAGVAIVARRNLPRGVEPVAERLASLVRDALWDLEAKGADMSSRIVVTIGGDHPSFPGETIVEAKVAAMKSQHSSTDDCPGCPIAHDSGD